MGKKEDGWLAGSTENTNTIDLFLMLHKPQIPISINEIYTDNKQIDH